MSAAPAAFRPDLYDYAFENDPVPTLNRLRAEDPVHFSRHGFWFLTRYADVAAVLKDPQGFSSAAAGWGGENPLARADLPQAGGETERRLSQTLAQSFNQMDPPDHTRVRMLVQKAFSRRQIEERAPRIEAVIQGLLDAAAAKGSFDLVTDLAFHVPIIVASEIIGIPADDREAFRAAFAAAALLMAPKRSEESWERALESGRWIGGYMRDLIADRRRERREDLVSDLIAAEEEGGRLTDGELSSAIATIYTAAGTTTERFISSGLFLLLSHREAWRALLDDPSLMPGAVEEILRFHHPTQSTSTNRRCTVEIEMGGKRLAAGDTVRVGLGAANRDPEAFADPDRFDIRRRPERPNLSFGAGPHFCIGSALARFEARLAFEAVLARFPEMRLVTERPVKDPARPDRYREILVSV